MNQSNEGTVVGKEGEAEIPTRRERNRITGTIEGDRLGKTSRSEFPAVAKEVD